MTCPAYYNEFDKQKAAWLRELIARNLIAPGDVDERSIHDVRPDDLRGYRQCHFFAGIGIWSYALRLAGWPDDREAWTGSCPCQPFSDAGKGEAFDDARHLWPVWFPLIEARRPLVCFGEQVASADGLAWIDLVHADLDGAGYTCGAVDMCAAGVGAPHKRQRLFFVADSEHAERWPERQEHANTHGRDGSGRSGNARLVADDKGDGRRQEREIGGRLATRDGTEGLPAGSGTSGKPSKLEHTEGIGRIGRAHHEDAGWRERPLGYRGATGRLGNSERFGCERPHEDSAVSNSYEPRCGVPDGTSASLIVGDARSTGLEGRQCKSGNAGQECATSERAGPVNGFWRDADWVLTRPQRVGDRPSLRPVEPGTFPLASGATARVGRLRGYGDGIVAQVAAEFVRAYLDLERAA